MFLDAENSVFFVVELMVVMFFPRLGMRLLISAVRDILFLDAEDAVFFVVELMGAIFLPRLGMRLLIRVNTT